MYSHIALNYSDSVGILLDSAHIRISVSKDQESIPLTASDRLMRKKKRS